MMKPQTMKDIIADKIRMDIMQGVLKLGQQVPEKHYAEIFEVSRTPVREAVLALASQGLINIRAQASSRVLSFTSESLRELFRARAFYELGALRAATPEAMSALISDLGDLHKRMSQFIDDPSSYEAFEPIDTSFHERIIAAAENSIIDRAYVPVQVALMAARSRLARDPGTAAQAHKDHGAVLDALTAGDLDAAEAALQSHFDWVLSDLLNNSEIVGTKSA